MNNPLIFIGKPIPYKGITFIYPPSINEVLTNPHFSQFSNTLTVSQEDIWDKMGPKMNEGETLADLPTPFELLLINSFHNKGLKQLVMDAFQFFTKEEVRILPEEKAILFTSNIREVKKVSDLRVMREEDFFDFQNLIREALGDKPIEAPDLTEDPRVARVKAKARERDRIKKKQSAKNGISLVTSMVSLCCMGIGVNPLNIGEISYASLNLLIRQYQEQEKYRGEIQFLAGGADPKKLKPKYWIRNLNE